MTEKCRKIEMNLDGRNSTYILGPLAGLELGSQVPSPPPVYVLDEAVARLHKPWVEQIQEGCAHAHHETLVLPGGEQIKTLAHLESIYRWLAQHAVSRDRTLVAVGGGALLDLAGLAAGTWRRGMGLVSFPTTLLAMVDAAIGGKTAINAASLKNPVGLFYPATAVLADPCFLSTLSRQNWRDGLAEMIKTAAIGDPELFQDIHFHRHDLRHLFAKGPDDEMVPGVLGKLPWSRWIGQAAQVKAGIVNRDFREKGERKNLNLGHTLGHVLEAHSQGTDQPLTHGEAVAIGMAVVFRVAAERGSCPLPVAVKMVEVLEACGLPITWKSPPVDEMQRLLGGDKKSSAKMGLRWVLPESIGKMNHSARMEISELTKWLED